MYLYCVSSCADVRSISSLREDPRLIIDYRERKEEYEKGRLKSTKDPLKANKHMRKKREMGQSGGADMFDDDVCGDEVASRRVGRS